MLEKLRIIQIIRINCLLIKIVNFFFRMYINKILLQNTIQIKNLASHYNIFVNEYNQEVNLNFSKVFLFNF